MMQGRILSGVGGNYQVLVNDEVIVCKASGRLRNVRIDENSKFNVPNKNKNKNKIETGYVKISPKAGDIVDVDLEQKYILDIHKRKNEMIRPDIANVDQIILLCSAKRPDFSYYLLDLFLANICLEKIEAIICVSKVDLLSDLELKELNEGLDYYRKIGYKVFFINSKMPETLKPVEEILYDKISVLAGQTGAGKSSFINAIIPGFKLQTNDISEALNRGKHTTRATSLYKAYGGFIGDSPGFSKLDLFNLKNNRLSDLFIEFKNYPCKFIDCNHQENIKGCSVCEAVKQGLIKKSRYENYLKMLKEK